MGGLWWRAVNLGQAWIFLCICGTRGTLVIMLPAEPWRELYRCDDLLQARAVATSIAGMEFDVRMRALGSQSLDDVELDDQVGDGPFVIEVRPLDWTHLVDVLAEIIDEQAEFDAQVVARRDQSVRRARVMLMTVAVVMAALAGNAAFTQCEHQAGTR